tara:strand:+ start:373 stop:489 length:117 start_codon:yes stop_codon:yes gene_type:complete
MAYHVEQKFKTFIETPNNVKLVDFCLAGVVWIKSEKYL